MRSRRSLQQELSASGSSKHSTNHLRTLKVRRTSKWRNIIYIIRLSPKTLPEPEWFIYFILFLVIIITFLRISTWTLFLYYFPFPSVTFCLKDDSLSDSWHAHVPPNLTIYEWEIHYGFRSLRNRSIQKLRLHFLALLIEAAKKLRLSQDN
jgi:hypothetical protein